MSLNWQLTDIKDWEEVCYEPKDLDGKTQLKAVTHGLIFTTISVGMGEITEKNWTEFYARSAIVMRLINGEEYTPEQIKQHIGLRTNVFPADTRLQFMKRVVDRHIADHKYRAEQWENMHVDNSV